MDDPVRVDNRDRRLTDTRSAAPAQLDELTGVLRRERQSLEVLVYRLVETRLLLGAGETRFLPWAASEVERSVARLRELELHRATVVHRLAEDLGLDADLLTLRALATDTPEPYRTVFDDHRSSFRRLVAEIESLTRESRAMADQGMRRAQDVVSLVDDAHAVIDPSMARSAYRAALAATARLSLPSLTGFLS